MSAPDELTRQLAEQIHSAIRRKMTSPLVSVARINKVITAVSIHDPKSKRPRIFYVSIEEQEG